MPFISAGLRIPKIAFIVYNCALKFFVGKIFAIFDGRLLKDYEKYNAFRPKDGLVLTKPFSPYVLLSKVSITYL